MSISIENLTHCYATGGPLVVEALQMISLTIQSGEFVGIIGQSGSGKSTLVQHFNGLLKPTSGKVFLEGQNIHRKGVKLPLIRKRIGMVFQYPEQQLFEETVFDDVAFGPRNMQYSGEEVQKRVGKSLQLVGLDVRQIGAQSPFQLSGGQKRRVAIAGVLAMEPDYLILDEPTANLDPKSREEMLALLKNLNGQGMTIIFVSHSMEEIARVVDKIFVMQQGKLLLVGSVAQVFREESALEEIGLALPEVLKLMHILQKRGNPEFAAVCTPAAAVAEILKGLKHHV